MSEIAIQSRGLTKHFRSGTTFTDLLRGRLWGPRVDALRGVDLQVRGGEIVALVGPNGAGKSTLLRLVAGLLLPDSGSLLVEDVLSTAPAFRRRVCYVVSDERSFSWRLNGLQNLEFFAALHGLRGSRSRQRIAEVLAFVELETEAGRPVREYSSGMRQRLALARGLLGDPKIFLFDEPTQGVDPRGAVRLRSLMRSKLVDAGRTALVATHDLADVRQLCTRLVCLEQGRITKEGTPAEVEKLMGLSDVEGTA
jgi:ABC-2 type transport system ATP-binding protein